MKAPVHLKKIYFTVLLLFFFENSHAECIDGFMPHLEMGMNWKVTCGFNKNYCTSADKSFHGEILNYYVRKADAPGIIIEMSGIGMEDIPQQAVVDPFTGKNITGEYIAAHEADYLKARDRLFCDARKKISMGQDKQSTVKQLEIDIAELQRKTAYSLKNVLSDNLSKAFVKDMQDVKALMDEPVTLEDIYRQAREKEGQIIIPPQVDSVFLDNINALEKKSDMTLLLKEFDNYKKLAAKNPGKMVSGNIILGAPDTSYFEPSEEAKRLSETGKAIERVLNNADTAHEMTLLLDIFLSAQSIPSVLQYQSVTFHAIDVVGSGRFIYPDKPSDRYICVLETLARQIISIKQNSIKNPDALLIEAKKIKEKDFRNFLEKLKVFVTMD